LLHYSWRKLSPNERIEATLHSAPHADTIDRFNAHILEEGKGRSLDDVLAGFRFIEMGSGRRIPVDDSGSRYQEMM
jgi:hypothetical protein